MTCVVGIEFDGGVLLGADSAASSGDIIRQRADAKLFRYSDDIVIGFTSSYRMGQLLRYSLKVTKTPPKDLDSWMARTFIPAVRETLADGGWLQVDKERDWGGNFLVAVRDRLYQVGPSFQMVRTADGYDAVGSGAFFALGSLYTTDSGLDRESGLDYDRTEYRVRKALEAAAYLTPGVTPPFLIERTQAAAVKAK